jgi:hypothetical protein
VAELVHARSPEVQRVQLKREDGGFTLVKRSGSWFSEAPKAYPADTTKVEAWLKSLLEDATVSRTVEGKPTDLSGYGLDKPAVELVLTTGGGSSRTLQLGAAFQSPGSSSPPSIYYAREAGDGRLFMLTTAQADELKKKKLDDLRDKKLVSVAEEKDVRKVTLRRGTGVTEIERDGGSDKWRIKAPFQAQAEKFDVETLVNQIKGAEADSFADDDAQDLAKYGLDQPRLTVELDTKQGVRAVVFGKDTPDGKIYAARQGTKQVAVVPKSLFEGLDKKAEDLRDRSLITVERDKIKSVELHHGSETIRLQKSGDAWQYADSANAPLKKAKTDTVERVLGSLTAPASKHVEEAPSDLAKYGLDAPTVTAKVSDGTGSSQVILVGKQAPDKQYYAKGVGSAVFEIQGFAYQDLTTKAGAFEDDSPAAKDAKK